jgi:hypothetical protein
VLYLTQHSVMHWSLKLIINDAKIHNSGPTGLQILISTAFVVLLLPYPRVCTHRIYNTDTLSYTVTLLRRMVSFM